MPLVPTIGDVVPAMTSVAITIALVFTVALAMAPIAVTIALVFALVIYCVQWRRRLPLVFTMRGVAFAMTLRQQ